MLSLNCAQLALDPAGTLISMLNLGYSKRIIFHNLDYIQLHLFYCSTESTGEVATLCDILNTVAATTL